MEEQNRTLRQVAVLVFVWAYAYFGGAAVDYLKTLPSDSNSQNSFASQLKHTEKVKIVNNLKSSESNSVTMYSKVFVLFLSVAYATGYLTLKNTSENRNSLNFRTLASYQQRLRNQGLLYNKPLNDNLQSGFDELETLQLIPITIKQLRQGLLSAGERLALRDIFGSIWDMIVDESRRKKSEPRNPVLSVLLNSREIRQGRQEIRAQFGSDTEGNSIQKIFNTQKSRPIKLTDDSTVDPSQRLLRMVAAIIQKSYKESSSRKDSIKLNNAKVTIRLPRKKRSIISVFSASSAEEQERLDKEEANEAEVMKAILGNDDDGDNSLEDDNASYEDDDYPEHATEEALENTTKVEVVTNNAANDVQQQVEVRKNDSHSEVAPQDYAYDESEGDEDDDDDDDDDGDDYLSDQFKPRFSPGDFENPSFNELIMLAARHRASKELNQKLSRTENGGQYRAGESDEYLDDYWA